MAIFNSVCVSKGLVAAFFAVILTGCSGTTYGTGTSSSAQLVEDVSSLVTIGQSKPRKKINYDARPKLVKVKDTNTLPTPAEKVESESAYFPENPEEKRARLRANASLDNNGEITPEVAALREESRLRGNQEKPKSDL